MHCSICCKLFMYHCRSPQPACSSSAGNAPCCVEELQLPSQVKSLCTPDHSGRTPRLGSLLHVTFCGVAVFVSAPSRTIDEDLERSGSRSRADGPPDVRAVHKVASHGDVAALLYTATCP